MDKFRFRKIVWSNKREHVVPTKKMRAAIEAIRNKIEALELFVVSHLGNGGHGFGIHLSNVMGVVTEMECDDSGVVTASIEELDTVRAKELHDHLDGAKFSLILFGTPDSYEDLQIKGVVWKEPIPACEVKVSDAEI